MVYLTSDEFLERLDALLSSRTSDQLRTSIVLSQTGELDSGASPSQSLMSADPVRFTKRSVVFSARLNATLTAAGGVAHAEHGDALLRINVAADDIDAFLERYNEICRSRLSVGLKRRDRRRPQKKAV